MDKIIFIDVETTGLNSQIHEIIEIAILGNGILYHKKIQPLNFEYADPKALEINGYSHEKWLNAIHPKDASSEIAEIIKGKTIVGHNVRFDMDFINELLHQYDCEVHYDKRLIDTITLAHEHLKPCGIKSISLDSIRAFFGWSVIGSHTALKDVQDTRRLYYKISKASRIKRCFWKYKAKLKRIFKMVV